jgi:SAM-dependent methyltransferase
LDLHFCRSCGHVQLLDVVDPAILFENYVYVSGTSPVFVRHFESYAKDLVRRARPAPDALAVDIGSNDGTLLGFLQKSGMRVLGVDPAKAIAADASRRGIETLNVFFTPELARNLRKERGSAAVVTANNVFAHADDLRGIAEGACELLAPEGVFAFEVSYLLDVVEKTLFDTIYHEHVAYHSVKPLRAFLASAGLDLFDAERVDTHGGSLRGYAQRLGGPHKATGAVERLVELERNAGLDRAETFKLFASDIDERKRELSALLRGFKAHGKRIAGFGAPAKATTLMHHFELGADVLDFVIDDSPLKQGLLTPGQHLPVLPAQALYDRKPDYALVLAWNFAPSIIAKHQAYQEAGGKFVVPLPRVEVL